MPVMLAVVMSECPWYPLQLGVPCSRDGDKTKEKENKQKGSFRFQEAEG